MMMMTTRPCPSSPVLLLLLLSSLVLFHCEGQPHQQHYAWQTTTPAGPGASSMGYNHAVGGVLAGGAAAYAGSTGFNGQEATGLGYGGNYGYGGNDGGYSAVQADPALGTGTGNGNPYLVPLAATVGAGGALAWHIKGKESTPAQWKSGAQASNADFIESVFGKEQAREEVNALRKDPVKGQVQEHFDRGIDKLWADQQGREKEIQRLKTELEDLRATSGEESEAYKAKQAQLDRATGEDVKKLQTELDGLNPDDNANKIKQVRQELGAAEDAAKPELQKQLDDLNTKAEKIKGVQKDLEAAKQRGNGAKFHLLELDDTVEPDNNGKKTFKLLDAKDFQGSFGQETEKLKIRGKYAVVSDNDLAKALGTNADKLGKTVKLSATDLAKASTISDDLVKPAANAARLSQFSHGVKSGWASALVGAVVAGGTVATMVGLSNNNRRRLRAHAA